MFFRILAFLVRASEWIQIMMSPFLFGIFLGILTYAYFPGLPGAIVGCLFALAGLFVGIIFASRNSGKSSTNELPKPPPPQQKFKKREAEEVI